MRMVVRSLWGPSVLAVAFVVAALYQQEIILRLGLQTLKHIRDVLPYAFHIGIWLSFAYLANRLAGIFIWDPIHRRVPVPKLLRDVTAALLYAVAITGIVGVVFNKPVGPFWAASGAAGIVIGLALRNVILDVFIGLAVNFDRPFEIGHFVQIANGPGGRVVELNWRTTRLVTPEGNMVVIPNGKLGEMIVTNFSKPDPVGEFEISVFLDVAVPTDRALRVINAAVRSVGGSTGVLDEPAPKARIRAVSAQGVEYKIKYMLDPRKAGPGKARHEILRVVLDQLRRAGLEPATPKQDVFHAPMPRRQLDVRDERDREALLARVELFHGLTQDERVLLAARMRERDFREGETLIRRGDAGESMFVLFEGLLNVMIAFGPDQPETRVARLQAGSFFGEMSVMTGEQRSATIVAATDSIVFEITKADIASLIQQRPKIAETIGGVIAARKLRNSQAKEQLTQQQQQAEHKTLTQQILGKMLAFFGLQSEKTEKNQLVA